MCFILVDPDGFVVKANVSTSLPLSRAIFMAASQRDLLLGTVLVTGGCGFLGSHIVEALLREPQCARVVVVSRNPKDFRFPGAFYLAADITDRAAVRAVLDKVKPRVIIHTVSPSYLAKATVQLKVNYEGTKLLLACATDHPAVKAFVYTSSTLAVVSTERVETEQTAVLCSLTSGPNAYARTKGATETYVCLANGTALKTTAIRVPGLYGPRDKTMMLPLLNTLKEGRTNIQLGDNSKYFEHVYVQSAARAHVLAARALLDGMHNTLHSKVDGEAFFISDGAPMKFWDFARAVWAAAGDTTRPEDIKVIPMWLILSLASIGEWCYWVFTCGQKSPTLRRQNLEVIGTELRFSIQKARTRLGYEPICDTKEGIRRTVAWFKEHEGWNRVERVQEQGGLFSRLLQASRPLIVPWRVFFGSSFESSMFEGKNFC
ncbi:hypothetical protein GJ744_006146 [Endocarpon pusillum]|uniref:Ketoreductase domain-containing protein n=1 Tax=Endocarpon pusillum TaxID=364733 RepID=A0A8H7DZB1_9EURO|nr:hypothetical protein GJ744_006146 [Endocarpon pusillum]